MLPTLKKNMTKEQQDIMLDGAYKIAEQSDIYLKLPLTDEDKKIFDEIKNTGICKEIKEWNW